VTALTYATRLEVLCLSQPPNPEKCTAAEVRVIKGIRRSQPVKKTPSVMTSRLNVR
jgi:hypothetical protein